MERLDQGHLHPKLEVPRLICVGRESEHPHMSPRHGHK
jgi:hypothetical protein